MTNWLTVSEAAAHVSAKDHRIIRDAIDAGDLPAYQYGKSSIRVKADEVDAWLEARPYDPRTGVS
jgi:excisionase family DNA binding protein